MASGRLASVAVTANTPTLVYTVPANNVASVNVVARNFGSTSSTVTLAHTANASAPTATSTKKVRVVKDGVPFRGFPEGTGNSFPTTEWCGVLPYANPTLGLVRDGSGITSYGHFALHDLTTGVRSRYSNITSTSSYWYGVYQIAPFFQNNDYWVLSQDGNNYVRRIKGKITDKTSWTVNSASDSDVFAYQNGTPSYGMAANNGAAGFRRMFVSLAQSSGNTTVVYNVDVGSTGSAVNYTSETGSFYNSIGSAYGTCSSRSLSVVPLKDASGNILSYHFVASGYITSETRIAWKEYKDDGSSYNVNPTYISIANSQLFPSTSSNAIAWFRCIGSWVYAMTIAGQAIKAPADGWQNPANWTNITANLPAGTDYNFAWMDDGYGNALVYTTAGMQKTSNGVTFTDFVSTTVPSELTGISGMPASDVYQVFKKDGSASSEYYVLTSNTLHESYTERDVGVISAGDVFEKNLPLDANAVVEHKGLVLNSGDKVYAITSQPTVVQVYGFEEGI